MLWEFWKRAKVPGTWKFYVKDNKSCIVNFCYSSFTGVFNGLRNSLPNSYFSMNLLVRAGKTLLTREWSQAKKWNRQVFQMLFLKSTVSFPNGIGAKYQKYEGPGCRLPHFPLKKLPVMLVNTFSNDQIEFTDMKILLSILLVLLFKCKYH